MDAGGRKVAGYSGRERAYRMRAPRDETPPGDAVTSALTAQVVLCIILAVCMLLVKRFGNEDYLEIKHQYGVMLSDTTQTSGLMERLLGENSPLAGFFSGLDNLLNKLTPGSAVKDAPVTPDEYMNEPEDEPPDTDASPQMDYNYLGEGARLADTASAGGMLPVDEKDTADMIPAPAGSTFSPIYLSTNIKPPVTGVITSGFSYRYHPLTGNPDFHTGLDIASIEGTPILAALSGEVVEVGYSEIYGNYIVLQHATNLKTSYSHCSEIIAEEGMVVRQGERVALVGETGTATGPHLHFSVIFNDEFADPALVLKDYMQLVEN